VTTSADLRDELMALLSARPLIRAAVFVPVGVVVVYGGLMGRIRDMELFLALVVVALVLAVVSAVRPWRGGEATDDARRRDGLLWQVLAGTVGVALLVPFLLVAVEVEVQRFAPFVAVLLVASVYSYPRQMRVPLSAWAIAVWVAVLIGDGIREVPVLVLHAGGAILVVVATIRVADILAGSLAEAAAARQEAERRASLLASLLRTNSLEPGDVLRATTSGLMASGFDVAVIRSIDPVTRTAKIVDGASRSELELREIIPVDGGLLGECIRAHRQVLVDNLDGDPRASDHGFGLHGSILVPLFDDDGEVTAVVSAASTAGPLTPAQVEAAELLAEQAGRALTRARAFASDQRTVDQLQHLDLQTRDFVSTVSHELRTPLTVIDGLGQTLLTRWDDLDTARRDDLLRRIDANADRLAVMVRSLLDTSALEHGQLELRLQQVDLKVSVEGLLHRLSSVMVAHPVLLEMDEDLRVRVDPGLFEHVVENLLTNVVKHTPEGTRAEIVARRQGSLIEITVTDDGPGIPAGDLPHVLDRFYRGGDLSSRISGGLGLGLALARQIVEAHGSELRVESAVGSGTRFSFRVPAVS